MRPNLSLIDIFTDMSRRVPTSVLQKAFASKGLIAGLNAEGTLKKITSIIDLNKYREIEKLKSIANWYFDDYLLHGEKAVYFYSIPPEDAKNLIDFFTKIKIEESVASTCFPLCIPDDQQADFANKGATLIETREYEEGIALIFSAVRGYSKRFLLPKRYLTVEALSKHPDADEIIAVENKYRQFFDTVVIFPNGNIEIRIDNPKLDSTKQLPVKDRAKAFVEINYIFSKLANDAFNGGWSLPTPYNFIDTLDKIFKTKAEGNIRLILFTTCNSNSKRSTANGKDPNDCCRDDAFVKAGLAKVPDISPYRLHVNWRRENNYHVDLMLQGTIFHLDKSKNALNEAIISKARTKNDYNFIRDTLLEYYTHEQAN